MPLVQKGTSDNKLTFFMATVKECKPFSPLLLKPFLNGINSTCVTQQDFVAISIRIIQEVV